MTKEFIPYEQALELKELGFDEECFAYYENDSMNITFPKISKQGWKWVDSKYTSSGKPLSELVPCENILAPLYQQAFRWFREKYGSFLLNDYGKVPHFTIIQNLMFESQAMTYEEAELACLKKIIGIVKNK